MDNKSIYTELRAVQSELKAPKSRTNNFGKFNYRSTEDILEAVKPLLASHGLLLTLEDEPVEIGPRIYIKATASITDGVDVIATSAYAREADGKTGMDVAQLTGACSSYARKYALNGLFLIDDTKDQDTDEFQAQTGKKKPDFGKPSPEATVKKSDGKQSSGIESAALTDLKAKMLVEGITEEQVLKAFCGKYSAIENIEDEVINTKIIPKWDEFIKFIGGTKK